MIDMLGICSINLSIVSYKRFIRKFRNHFKGQRPNWAEYKCTSKNNIQLNITTGHKQINIFIFKFFNQFENK